MLVKNQPIKWSQDLVMRLLFEEKNDLLDLDCDYTNSRWLSCKDSRYGKTRLALLLENDHQRPLFSLIRYHVCSLRILATCAQGVHSENQNKIASQILISVVVDNILDLDVLPNGEKARQVDADALRHVHTAWISVLRHVYWSCESMM